MHFFIVPFLNCNADCSYCYSKKNEGSIINKLTLNEVISFIHRLSEEQNISKTHISFHGGEPLLANSSFYTYAIPLIFKGLDCENTFGVQSNLWLLDEALCRLFKEYNVGISTSLDGPPEINDQQRGEGYFTKTSAGLDLLKNQGLSCGCIATFTRHSSEHLEEIFDFFVLKGFHFDVHAAIKPFDYPPNSNLFLKPEDFGKLLIRLLDLYLKNITKIKIGTLDTLIKNVANKKSGLCTFTRCLGEYFAISPEGELYTCNRFVGNKDFCIGNISDVHSFSDITKSEAWKKQQAWHEWIDKECGACLFKDFCNGGCPYNAFASDNYSFVKDPHCEAYKMIYNCIVDKGVAEFFSNENVAFLNHSQYSDNETRFQNNPVLYLMKDNPHPYDVVKASKKIITAALLGKTANVKQATEILFEMGIVSSIEEKLPVIEQFYSELSQSSQGFNNLYLHITNHCNLSCSHCYSYSGNEVKTANLSPEIIIQLIKEASNLSFRKVIFTGGEPLLFPDLEILLDELHLLRYRRKLPALVLRTNLSGSLNVSLVGKINSVFDRIIVSIDGSQETHDRQRGKGAYLKTMNNLALFNTKTIEKKVTFACVLNQQAFSPKEIENIKNQLYSLKCQYPVKDIRFLPLLSLGRAMHTITRRNEAEILTVSEWMKRKYYFRTSCGLGQSVMIESNGDVYPCHVLKETEKHIFGNVYNQSLQAIAEQPAYRQLRDKNVNTINKCGQCDMRYLCGGVCKIWENQDCSDLFNRARYLLKDALQICNISISEFYP
jgi:uncharacterized protein